MHRLHLTIYQQTRLEFHQSLYILFLTVDDG